MTIRFQYLKFIFVLILSALLLSFTQSSKFVPKHSAMIASDKGLEMLKQCSRTTPENVDGYFDLTKNDIEGLENNFKNVLKVQSTGCCLTGINIEKLNEYGFQFIGFKINDKKYIYLNAFKIHTSKELDDIYKDWKINPIIACDGGVSFWGVLYNIETGEFTQLAINGVA